MSKSSRGISLGAMTALSAVVMAGCANDVTADCVDTRSRDGAYRVMDDRFCEGNSHSSYRYVYGGSHANGWIRGGTFNKPPDTDITTRSGRVVQRGGFGGRGGSRGG